MSVDKVQLKALAEAFPSDLDWDSNTEPFFNGPSGESLGGGSDGTYTVYGKPFRLEGEDYDYDGPTYVERCGVDFAKFMVSAREGVLHLLAENERLEREAKNDLIAYKAVIERQNELRVERDHLKVENEALAAKVAELERWPGEPAAPYGWHVEWADSREHYLFTKVEKRIEVLRLDSDVKVVQLYTAPPAPVPALRDERAAFEDWADRNWPGAQRQQLERDDYESYKNSCYRDFWTGWQARARLDTDDGLIEKNGDYKGTGSHA